MDIVNDLRLIVMACGCTCVPDVMMNGPRFVILHDEECGLDREQWAEMEIRTS